MEFWWVRMILLFAPLCKVLHSRAFRSLGEPHYNSGKITNTLRFVFICASCLRHSNNWGLGNYSRNFTVGELRAKSITRNLLNSNSSRWIKDDDSWCIRALIGGTLQFWVEKNWWRTRRIPKEIDSDSKYVVSSQLTWKKSKWAFWDDGSDKTWFIAANGDNDGVNSSELPHRTPSTPLATLTRTIKLERP